MFVNFDLDGWLDPECTSHVISIGGTLCLFLRVEATIDQFLQQ